MKNNTYQHAVDHLEFSDDLYEKVVKNAHETRRPVRLLGVVAAVVMITALLATTAAAVTSLIKEHRHKQEITVPVQTLGTQQDSFEDAQIMHFSVSTGLQGVKTHYMELALGNGINQYQFLRGMLYDWAGTYYRITEDYQLETLEFKSASGAIHKGEDRYSVYFAYKYFETQDGVVSVYHGPMQKNAAGEILINVYDMATNRHENKGDPAWPAYLNTQTGELRDALPQLSPADFEGRICYTERLKNGILFTTIVNEGTKQAANQFYLVDELTLRIVKIALPSETMHFVYQDSIYCQDKKGRLYRMDDSFEFHLISEYETPALFGGGFLTVRTDDGELGVYDVERNLTYVFDGITVTDGELERYSTMRRGNQILLMKRVTNWELMGAQITMVGVLDLESNELKLLSFENDLVILHCSWLEGERLAMIYQQEERQYLCIYEFE